MVGRCRLGECERQENVGSRYMYKLSKEAPVGQQDTWPEGAVGAEQEPVSGPGFLSPAFTCTSNPNLARRPSPEGS